MIVLSVGCRVVGVKCPVAIRRLQKFDGRFADTCAAAGGQWLLAG